MPEVNAGVDDRDDGTAPGRGVPRLLGPDLLRAPLLRVERVVRRGLGGAGHERGSHDGGGSDDERSDKAHVSYSRGRGGFSAGTGLRGGAPRQPDR